MYHIRTSVYLILFYLLMCISISLMIVYKFSFSKTEVNLEQESYNKEKITLLYIKNNIKKENALVSTMYDDIEDTEINKALLDPMDEDNTLIIDNNKI